jgi:hypothetical protein
MAKEVIFITGKDPCGDTGGHSSLVRSTVRAATRLGFTLQRRARETFIEKFSAGTFTSALGDLYAELGFKCGHG